MSDTNLTRFQAAELQYLRTEVDRSENDAYRNDPPPNAQDKLFRARRELREFTRKLRVSGKNI